MLAAQAQGGSAGVQANLAAQQEIAARTQATVAQMQADAVKRGSPIAGEVGAMTTAGSDALLNQLAVMQANAGAEDASRSARMADYGRQAAMAGGLIPLQAQADASLIRARGEMDIARINAQGRNNLEETRLNFANQRAAREQDRRDQIEAIKWQMRADEKKSSAEAAAKAAKENTLSADELEAMAMLGARRSMGTRIGDSQRRLASTPRDPEVRATQQSNGTFLLDPSILKPTQTKPTAEQLKEYEQVTGRKAPANVTLDEVRKVIGGVGSPDEARRNQILRRAPQQARSGIRAGAYADVQQAQRDYVDPIAMRDAVATEAAALRDQGYVVTPEVMARLLNQPFLSAQQMDLRDQGQPYTAKDITSQNETVMQDAERQDLARIANDFSVAFSNLPDTLDPAVREAVQGLQFDVEGLVKAADADYPTIAAFLDENPDLPAQLAKYIEIVDNPDMKDSEREAEIRVNFPNPAHRRILSYIVLGK
jgi:hypothetical protein